MTAVMPDAARLGYEIHGWVPVGVLTVDDVDDIDLDVPFEIQDGELLLMAPPSAWHEYASDDVKGYLKRRCSTATGELFVPTGQNVRRPDVVGLSVSRQDLVRERTTTLSPSVIEVIVEIISHDGNKARDRISVARDREQKFREYADAGIPEYWIVDEAADDPLDASVEIYRLRDGSYVPVRVVLLSQLLTEQP
ncbi:Uma2 family endonuclease [Hamadaea sp. NPDC051192]|uniref:Uma2 family endonuclease n=1 Tax=Hamadaea sp. NPDC051192 TaxID=3154940 RepID=UPI003438A765